MIWHDITIAIANILFTYSLVYQVHHGFKEKKAFLTRTTSSLTSVGLYVMAISFYSLLLPLSSIACGINASLWYTLFLQTFTYKKA